MIAVLIFLAFIGAFAVLARAQLPRSPFNRYFFMPWGEIYQAPALFSMIAPAWTPPDGLETVPPNAPPALIAQLVNRDRLARPLQAVIVNMALRQLLTLSWRPESEEFILQRLAVADPEALSKLDRALLSKLFPNEATEFIISWRSASDLGAARRLLDRAMAKRVGKTRLELPLVIRLGSYIAAFLVFCTMMAITGPGLISVMLPLLLTVWPGITFSSAAMTYRAFELHRAMPAERFQARFLILACLSLALALSALILLLITFLAYGFMTGLAATLTMAILPLPVLWVRYANRLGRGHLSASQLMGRLESLANSPKPRSEPLWEQLPGVLALGAEHIWANTVRPHAVPATVTTDDAEPSDDTDATNEITIDTDTDPKFALPPGLNSGSEVMPISQIESLFGYALWFDIWLGTSLDYLLNLTSEMQKLRQGVGKSRQHPA